MAHAAIDAIRRGLRDGRLSINALDDGSGVLLDIEGEQLLTLNRTGLLLIQAVEGGADDVAELGAVLTAEFEVEPERAERDAEGFLDTVRDALRG
ncbi:MAG: PqqD family protein [Wenzhouxiangellaceae bacterium]|nr:PqqD family protein [Wenzhouxiangellaceae bacterium]